MGWYSRRKNSNTTIGKASVERKLKNYIKEGGGSRSVEEFLLFVKKLGLHIGALLPRLECMGIHIIDNRVVLM